MEVQQGVRTIEVSKPLEDVITSLGLNPEKVEISEITKRITHIEGYRIDYASDGRPLKIGGKLIQLRPDGKGAYSVDGHIIHYAGPKQVIEKEYTPKQCGLYKEG